MKPWVVALLAVLLFGTLMILEVKTVFEEPTKDNVVLSFMLVGLEAVFLWLLRRLWRMRNNAHDGCDAGG